MNYSLQQSPWDHQHNNPERDHEMVIGGIEKIQGVPAIDHNANTHMYVGN